MTLNGWLKFQTTNMSQLPTIIYTKTDEAPALATYPFCLASRRSLGIAVETRDISLAGRISAKMLSIVPLMKGGGVFEPGDIWRVLYFPFRQTTP
jgi:monomeric isocitrate dehydrogenase